MEVVGYKLTNVATGETVQSWGGTWGQCPAIPNPIRLPSGGDVCAPSINVDYSGFMLVPWEMDQPLPSVPVSVTPRQVRLLLLSQGLLDQVETMISQQDRAAQITWEFAIEFRRDDPLLNTLGQALGLDATQIDQFFLAASQL